jgi:hypothetical protein
MDWNDCMNERRKLPNYLASIYHTEDSWSSERFTWRIQLIASSPISSYA